MSDPVRPQPIESPAATFWLKESRYAGDFADMAALDKQCSRNPFTVPDFYDLMASGRVNGHIAEADGKVVGYVIYELKDREFAIRKFEVHPDYADKGVREQLADLMVSKLSDQAVHGRNKVSIMVHVDDTPMQLMLRDRFHFTNAGQQPVKRQAFPDGGSGVAMEYDMLRERTPITSLTLYDPALVATHAEAEAPQKKPYLRRGELLVEALPRLKALTGMEWELVKPDNSGALVAQEPDPFMRQDGEMHFRTKEMVANPQTAMAALQAFLGVKAERRHAPNIQRAGRVDFPTGWMRPIHLEHGQAGQLAPHFVKVYVLPYGRQDSPPGQGPTP